MNPAYSEPVVKMADMIVAAMEAIRPFPSPTHKQAETALWRSRLMSMVLDARAAEAQDMYTRFSRAIHRGFSSSALKLEATR